MSHQGRRMLLKTIANYRKGEASVRRALARRVRLARHLQNAGVKVRSVDVQFGTFVLESTDGLRAFRRVVGARLQPVLKDVVRDDTIRITYSVVAGPFKGEWCTVNVPYIPGRRCRIKEMVYTSTMKRLVCS